MPKTYDATDLINDYKTTSRWRRLSDSSRRAYHAAFNAVLPYKLVGNKPVADTSVCAIRPIHIEALYAHLCDMHSLATANLYISVCGAQSLRPHSVLNWSSTIRSRL